MSNLVLSAAGAAVGYMIGGPTGAQIGWMAGSAVSARNAKTGQPTVGDLRVQTAQYGVAIPVITGAQRIAGNVIWAADKTTYTNTSGGKGGSSGSTSTTGFKVSLAISLCKGLIVGIGRVWADGTLLIDPRTSGANLIGVVYTGSNTQNPDPTMQSHLGSSNVPAYRGLAYIVLTDYDLGVSGRIPNFTFEVYKSGGI